MSVLNWDKPAKKMSKEEWTSISADGAPPGVYTPNMSKEDSRRWNAKYISGKDPRVEIRKSFYFHNGKKHPSIVCFGSQVVITVRLGTEMPNVLISTNGKIPITFNVWEETKEAIEEAINKLKESGDGKIGQDNREHL